MTTFTYPTIQEQLKRHGITLADYSANTPWYAPYTKDGGDHFFCTVRFGSKIVLAEVIEFNPCLTVQAIEGAPFCVWSSRSARAMGAPPVQRVNWLVVKPEHCFTPVAKIVDGEYIEIDLAGTKLPNMERAEHRQKIELENEAQND